MKRKLFLTPDDINSYVRTDNGLTGKIFEWNEWSEKPLYRVVWDHPKMEETHYLVTGKPYESCHTDRGWINEVSTEPFVYETPVVHDIESLTQLVLDRDKITKLHPNQCTLGIQLGYLNGTHVVGLRITLENGVNITYYPREDKLSESKQLPEDVSLAIARMWRDRINQLNTDTKAYLAKCVADYERQIKEHLK
jgi:hypothetical protein